MKVKKSRIVVDTNLWISYLISKEYMKLDKLILSNKMGLVFSRELIDEFIEVSQRPKFIKYFQPKDIEKLLDLFDIYGELVKIKSNINICRDSKDNFLLSLAKDSKADYLLTGDNDLLELKIFGKTAILTMSEFLRLI